MLFLKCFTLKETRWRMPTMGLLNCWIVLMSTSSRLAKDLWLHDPQHCGVNMLTKTSLEPQELGPFLVTHAERACGHRSCSHLSAGSSYAEPFQGRLLLFCTGWVPMLFAQYVRVQGFTCPCHIGHVWAQRAVRVVTIMIKFDVFKPLGFGSAIFWMGRTSKNLWPLSTFNQTG